MAKFTLTAASQEQLRVWDDFVDRSASGTIFHKLCFLRYHGNRFSGQERHLVLLKGQSVIGQVSLAVRESEGLRIARSPYGGSYGGFVFERVPTYSHGRAIVGALLQYLHDEDISQLILTNPIACCSRQSLDTFTFNLLEAGFRSVNRDISSVVRFEKNKPIESIISSNARNMARKAVAAGVNIVHRASLDDFYSVTEAAFAKHRTVPTHNLDELQDLLERLPRSISLNVAYSDGFPIAGICLFVVNRLVNSSFYVCQRPEAAKLQGLSLLVLNALEQAQADGFWYFDFGTSTVNMQARPSVFRFKENYSHTGVFRETFEWHTAR